MDFYFLWTVLYNSKCVCVFNDCFEMKEKCDLSI